MELIEILDTKINNRSYAKFLCAYCDSIVEKRLDAGKKQKSCGCVKNELISESKIKHDDSFSSLYSSWSHLKNRCENTNNDAYKDYGGRGITICNEWANDYTVFRDWALNNGYQENLQINRINNDGNYEPNNCNWVTSKENSRNRRGQKIKNIEIANEIRSLWNTGNCKRNDLAKKYNISIRSIADIILGKTWT